MNSGSTNCEEFRSRLRAKLLANCDKTLLRIAIAPDFHNPITFTGGEILERAEGLASGLRLDKERSVVLMLLPHSPELFLLQIGLVLQGHVPAILAWPTSRVDAEKYQRNRIHQLIDLPADLLATMPSLTANLVGHLPYPVQAITLQNESASLSNRFAPLILGEVLHSNDSTSARTADTGDPDVLFLQFSGGTTGSQKAIAVTATMLETQLDRLAQSLQFTSKDEVVSWLPLYHDMGLVACLWLPLWCGATSLQFAANDWVINPELLFQYVDRYRATFCWLPNFAFSYLSQHCEQMRGSYDLGSMRGWINCSEPIRQRSVTDFANTFSEWGVAEEKVLTSYAMAETTFAVTQSEVGQTARSFRRSLLGQGRQEYEDRAFDLIDEQYVSSGKPLPDTKVRIVAGDRTACAEGVAGEILVQSPSLFHGYWGSKGFQTHSLLDEWHATGDYGFVADGELYVIGRYKDIVVVGGNNIFPEDVEAIVNTVDGIHPGRVVAFGVEDAELGTQSLSIAAEMNGSFHTNKATELESVIRKLVLATIGIAARYVSVVPSRWIVKSTAGKISRKETRERFMRERLVRTGVEVTSDAR